MDGHEARLRVLIADDVSDLRLLLRLALESWGGFEIVGEAGDGAEAVTLTESAVPDAIVLDLSMPVMDGLEAIPLIRSRTPGVHIVVLSGFPSESMESEAIARGADAYLEKSAAISLLAATIRRVCLGIPVS